MSQPVCDNCGHECDEDCGCMSEFETVCPDCDWADEEEEDE